MRTTSHSKRLAAPFGLLLGMLDLILMLGKHTSRLALLALLGAVACGDNLHAAASDGPSVDAAIDAAPCVPTTTKLESLTSGELVMDATQAENTAPLVVALGRSVLFTSLREDEPSPNFGGVLCDLHDVDLPTVGTPAGVSCFRNNAGTDTGSGIIHVRWTVATFSTGVTVQRGHADTNVVNPAAVALPTTVDLSKSFVLLGGNFNGGSGWGNNEFVQAHLSNAQTLSVTTAVPGTEVAWQVVSMNDAVVQRGTATLATADTEKTAQITATPDGLVLITYTTDNASGIAASTMMLRAHANGSVLTFSRDLAGSQIEVAWEVVKLPFLTHAGETAFAAGEAAKTVSVDSLKAATSVAVATNQAIQGQSNGSTTYAGADLDLLGEAAVTLEVSDGSIGLTRATSQASATIDWTATDFSTDRCSAH